MSIIFKIFRAPKIDLLGLKLSIWVVEVPWKLLGPGLPRTKGLGLTTTGSPLCRECWEGDYGLFLPPNPWYRLPDNNQLLIVRKVKIIQNHINTKYRIQILRSTAKKIATQALIQTDSIKLDFYSKLYKNTKIQKQVKHTKMQIKQIQKHKKLKN